MVILIYMYLLVTVGFMLKMLLCRRQVPYCWNYFKLLFSKKLQGLHCFNGGQESKVPICFFLF